ncbi:MAG: ParB/RepB/Spo0J family partition protein [Acidimicrobiia bacterium]|nr:ParB/RepB/Spo0J family partition protein [Acidimicrobiia bacterium]
MAARKSGLGRGLDALIPVDRSTSGVVPVDAVDPNPQQPRSRFDEEALEGLAASIREVGVLQPIVVRPEGERYVLVAGERRLRASRMAGLDDIPAVIRGTGDATTSLTEALIENVQREDLSPLEEAGAFRQLMEDFGLRHDDIAARVGKSRTTVTNVLRLLQLPASVQGLIDRGDLSTGHGKALASLEDEAYCAHIADKAAEEGWSVRAVEEAVRARSDEPSEPVVTPRQARVRPAAIIELEERLRDQLGTKVRIDFNGDKGKMVIGFSSLDDLERIYRKFYG